MNVSHESPPTESQVQDPNNCLADEEKAIFENFKFESSAPLAPRPKVTACKASNFHRALQPEFEGLILKALNEDLNYDPNSESSQAADTAMGVFITETRPPNALEALVLDFQVSKFVV